MAMEKPLFFIPSKTTWGSQIHCLPKRTTADGGKDNSAANMFLKASLWESTHNKYAGLCKTVDGIC